MIVLLIVGCDELLVSKEEGCTTATACNYDAVATQDNGSCVDPQGCNEWCVGDTLSAQELDCKDICGGEAEIDNCGVCTGGTTGLEENYLQDCAGECGGSNICGCTDATALNYDQATTFNDDNCEYYPIINCNSTQTATINMDGAPEDWSSLIPAVTDPEGNSVCGTDTDIKYIYTAIDNNYAYIMVETYNKPIHPTATVEINFSFALGALHTNISNNVNAWKPYPDTYPINDEIVVRENVIEIKIPLIELERWV